MDLLSKYAELDDEGKEMYKNYTCYNTTDFAVMLGCITKDQKKHSKRKPIMGFSFKNYPDGYLEDSRVVGIMPEITFEKTKSDLGKLSEFKRKRKYLKTKEFKRSFKYGEYPQTAVKDVLAAELEILYEAGDLEETGKTYTTDSVYYGEPERKFEERKHIEYEYEGKKYVRMVGDFISCEDYISDGRKVVHNKPYWIEVKPIEWEKVYETEDKVTIRTKNVLLSGIQHSYLQETDFIRKVFFSEIKPVVRQKVSGKKSETGKKALIYEIIEEINSYAEIYKGSRDIPKEVESKTTEYNDKIKLLEEERKEHKLVLEDENTIYLNLIMQLEKILDNLKIYKDRISGYTDFIDILEVDQRYKNKHDDLYVSIKAVKETVLPYLDNPEVTSSFKDFLAKEIESTNKQIEDLSDISTPTDIEKVKSLDELKNEFRAKFHRYLIQISAMIKEKDALEKIKEMLVKKEDSVENKTLSNAVYESIAQIKESGNEDEIKELDEILKRPKEEKDDNYLKEIANDIFKLNAKVRKRVLSEDYYDSLLVDPKSK